MSCHYIYIADGVKKMRPICSREEYLKLRNGGEQSAILAAVRSGDESRKRNLVQFNYSCLPNDDGTLKGSKRMSTTVAMDIDHVPPEEMQPLQERILSKKEELGLKMLEESARGKGYHLVFARKLELSQEENLKWASQMLGVDYDKGAKDITRVFYTTTEHELVCLDDAIFAQQEFLGTDLRGFINKDTANCADESSVSQKESRVNPCQDNNYNGMEFSDIIAKYWEMFNGGKVPNTGDRNVLTFELAVTLRAQGHALPTETGAAGHEINGCGESLRRHDADSPAHAKAPATTNKTSYKECAVVLQACRSQRRVPRTRCPPARRAIPLLG